MTNSFLPARVATGGFILHSGLQKWGADEGTAQGMHGMAAGAYPFLAKLEPTRFLKLLASTEIVTGAALLTPVVPNGVAGVQLTGFSSALVGLYARTPGMREPGSIWPTSEGIGLSKDAWMLGVGLSMLADAWIRRRRTRG